MALRGIAACLAVEVAVPVVLDGIVRAAGQELGDGSPPVAKLSVLHNNHTLLWAREGLREWGAALLQLRGEQQHNSM